VCTGDRSEWISHPEFAGIVIYNRNSNALNMGKYEIVDHKRVSRLTPPFSAIF